MGTRDSTCTIVMRSRLPRCLTTGRCFVVGHQTLLASTIIAVLLTLTELASSHLTLNLPLAITVLPLTSHSPCLSPSSLCCLSRHTQLASHRHFVLPLTSHSCSSHVPLNLPLTIIVCCLSPRRPASMRAQPDSKPSGSAGSSHGQPPPPPSATT